MGRTGVVVGAACLLLAGCGNAGIPDAVTEQGQDAVNLWKGVIATGIGVAVLVWGLIGYAAIRGRLARRRDAEAIPGQRQDNLRLELAYFGAPIVIVAVLFGFSLAAQQRIVDVSPDPDLEVEVVGYQWGWQFRYQGESVVVTGSRDQPPVLVLPTDRTVQLDLVADDVIHSFWVPQFVSKRDLIPGVDNEIDVNLTETGTFVGRCAEFCGLEHWSMQFSVESVSPEDFDAWLADAAAAEQPIIGSLES